MFTRVTEGAENEKVTSNPNHHHKIKIKIEKYFVDLFYHFSKIFYTYFFFTSLLHI